MIARLLDALCNIPPLAIWRRQPTARIARPRSIHNADRLKIGYRTRIRDYSLITPIIAHGDTAYSPTIDIGDNVYIGRYVWMACIDRITISDNCVLSDHVYVADVAHGIDPRSGPILDQPLESKGPVFLGRQCFIGFGARILPGVTLGDFCVVGTNSVVTRSFDAYSMVSGAPARLVKRYDPASGTWMRAR